MGDEGNDTEVYEKEAGLAKKAVEDNEEEERFLSEIGSLLSDSISKEKKMLKKKEEAFDIVKKLKELSGDEEDHLEHLESLWSKLNRRGEVVNKEDLTDEEKDLFNAIWKDEVEIERDESREEELIKKLARLIKEIEEILVQEKNRFEELEDIEEEIENDLQESEELLQRIAEIQDQASLSMMGGRENF